MVQKESDNGSEQDGGTEYVEKGSDVNFKGRQYLLIEEIMG